MTGPEHYRQAEQLVDDALNLELDAVDVVTMVAAAQAHATLALAAATIAVGDRAPGEWREII